MTIMSCVGMFGTVYTSAVLCFLFPLCRPVGFWLSRVQSLLYCNEHGVLGSFSEEVKSCICPVEHPTCQGVIPCIVGTSSSSCSSCATDNATRCGACHHGNILHLGSCRPSIAASLDHYLSLDLDMPDAEVLRTSYTYMFSIGSLCGPNSTVALISALNCQCTLILVSQTTHNNSIWKYSVGQHRCSLAAKILQSLIETKSKYGTLCRPYSKHSKYVRYLSLSLFITVSDSEYTKHAKVCIQANNKSNGCV